MCAADSLGPLPRVAIDLHALELYLAVFGTGSMTAAAERMQLTQSAVSRQILRLEAELGVPLFDRASRPMLPTPAGRRLAQSAERLLSQAASLRNELLDANQTTLTQLRLGIIDSLSDPLVPQLIKAMRHTVDAVSIFSGFMEPLRQKLINGELDAVISADPFDDLDRFDRHELFSEQFIALVPKDVPPFRDEESFRRFATTSPMIRSGAATGIARRVEQQFRRTRLEVPHAFACDTIDSIISFVAAGLGWTILTPSCIRKCANHVPFLQVLPLPGPAFARRIYLVTRSGELTALKPLLVQTCRTIVATQYVPALGALAPWLGAAVTVAK
ncbi:MULTISPECIES: LysR family transcriptional regulator [Paracoccus]|jgi:DNA-binding transcriptional LysR family regulator|uniref:LysR family transcriptional regulator n=1 Tax=Paracoccus TaxID=265 RepID=UPI001E64A605|nr:MULTISPECIES: LysR family transcriptional regulator [Paracoccus]MDK8874602.1 LysR family transcriptional regulator [Paracoccus sp. SSJ]UFS64631.1 LysR family transcriptional regulator [Paracoccus denitrificans]